jgi:hypothetical protein
MNPLSALLQLVSALFDARGRNEVVHGSRKFKRSGMRVRRSIELWDRLPTNQIVEGLALTDQMGIAVVDEYLGR